MKKLGVILASILATTLFGACKNEEDELLRMMEQYRADKCIAYAEENAQYEDYQVDVAFLGDSLTDGYDLKKYYPQYFVANRGIGGETTIGLENRMQVSLYDLKPKIAVMLIGANNMSSMFENYERLLQGMKENVPNTRIILLSLTSMSGDWGKNNQLAAYNNVKIKMLAEKYSLTFVDVYSPLLNIETGELYQEYTTDGGHLTALGYQVLTREITPVIEREMLLWNIANQER